ncbi:MAG: CHAT domain-containing tetratricopeptide repeat protein [bacterium]
MRRGVLAVALAIASPVLAVEPTPDVLDSLSAAALDAGDLTAARDHAVRAAELRAAATTEPSGDVAIGWHEAGLSHYRLEDYEPAYAALTRAVTEWERVPDADPTDVVWAESDLAEMARLTGRFDVAESRLADALSRARASGDPGGFLPALANNLGTLLWDEDRLDEAEPLLREALALRASDPETPPLSLARAHQSLGVVMRSQHRYDDAEREFVRALSLAREAAGPDRRDVVPYLNGLAGVYSRVGRLDDALALREESLGILGSIENPSRPLLAEILEATGDDLLAKGDAESAERRYAECVTLRRELFGATHPSLGPALLGAAEAKAARFGVGDRRVRKAVVEALNQLEGAPAFSEARAGALALRARHLHAHGKQGPAIEDLRTAVALLDTLRAARGGLGESRAWFTEEHRAEIDDLVTWLVEADDVAGAVAESERMRGRLFAEQLADAHLEPTDVPADVRERLAAQEKAAHIRVNETRRRLRAVADADLPEADRRDRLAALDSTLTAAALELRDAQEQLRLYSPRFQRLLRDLAGDVSLPAADSGEALLVYHVGERESFVFSRAAGRDGFRATRLRTTDGASLPESTLRARWEPVAEDLHRPRGASRGVAGTTTLDRGSDILAAELRSLGDALLPAEALADVSGARRLAILPDRVLHSVPFEALRVAGPEGDAWALDVLPPVRYAPSLRTPPPARDAGDGSVLIVADPASDLPALPAARAEAAAVAAAFPDARVVRLEGPAATENAVRDALPAARFVHFATHAIADRGPEGLLASIVLTPAPSGATDGFLHLFELYELSLRCDLAWLSACDTNSGPVLAGEGAFAISRGFLVAGARGVVASAWPLHDAAAAAVVGAFFADAAGEAGDDRSDPVARLAAAKKKVRARYPDPHQWAPFLFVGAASDRQS